MKRSVMMLMAVAGLCATATDYTWQAGGRGAWNADTNWEPQGVPGAGDCAYFPEAVEVTDDFTVATGTLVITNGAGTVSFKGIISGSGKLILQGCGEKRFYRDNTFTGGMEVYGTGYRPDGSLIVWNGGTFGDSGAVRIYSGGGLGVGEAIFDRNEGSDKSKGYIYNTGCRLYVDGDMTVTTPINIGFNRDGNPQIYINAKEVTFAETVSNSGARNAYRFTPNYGRINMSKYFKVNGYYSLYNCEAWLMNTASVGTFYVDTSATAHLTQPVNMTYMLSLNGKMVCEAENVFSLALGTTASGGHKMGASSALNLNGYSQTQTSVPIPLVFSSGSIITSPVARPMAFLNFQGMTTGLSELTLGAQLRGRASICWNPTDAAKSLTLSGADNSTSGELIVSNGVMKLSRAAFTALSRVMVCAGARLELDDASVAALRVRQLVIDSTAQVVLGSSAGGTAIISQVTVVDHDSGVATDLDTNATYGATGNADVTPVSVFAGPGKVSVPSPQAIYWRKAQSGAWEDSGNWFGGRPSTALPTLIEAAGEDYVVSLAESATIANLSIVNPLAGTTTLSVPGSLSSTKGVWELGQGARMVIPEGGLVTYRGKDDANPADYPNTFNAVRLSDGAELEVRGRMVVTNMTGRFTIGGDDLSVTSRLVVAGSGEFLYAGDGGVRTSYFTLQKNGQVEVRDQAKFTYVTQTERYMWNQTGGSFRFRDQAQYYFPDKTWDICFGPGTFLFEDDSAIVYSGAVSATARLYFSNSEKTIPLEVTFKDHAKCVIPGSSNFEVRPSQGASIIYRFYSDAESLLGNCQFGRANSGYITMYLTNGAVNAAGDYGFIIGGSSIYGQNQSFLTGIVYQTGGRLLVKGAAGSSAAQMNGFVLGDALPSLDNRTVTCLGRYELQDGLVTNYHGGALFTLGVGKGRGEFIQTGGEFAWQGGTYLKAPAVIGFANGSGLFALSNGVARMPNAQLWIGGIHTNTYGHPGYNYTTKGPLYFEEYNDAEGQLTVMAADTSKPCSFTVGKPTVVGGWGRGVLEVGPGGSFAGTDLVLSNQTASVLRMSISNAGAGRVALSGALTVAPGAKLEIDASARTLRKGHFQLLDCTSLQGAFAPTDITCVSASGCPAELRISSTGIRYVQLSGMTINFR
ncbi:MAG: hypothetical protein MJ240_08135 [Kiritimatiellae bacterium]|nr:hypothetical protein [Kiritimatiellia bacterium]